MRAAGIVVEYNPFHNGHKYHLENTREITSCDVVVAVMSSNFLQRGEPAIVNKWSRTETALLNGVDLIIELPTIFSNQNAEIFGLGSVSLLDKLKVESIVFGSESGSIEDLKNIALLQETQKDLINQKVKDYINTGISYPNAFDGAMKEAIGIEGAASPNNILGLEYIKAINKINPKITPLTIKRFKADYHSKEICDEIASATAIRELISKDSITEVKKTVPITVYNILQKEVNEKRIFSMKNFYEYLRYRVISAKESLAFIQDVESGFENRIFEAAISSNTFDSFFEALRTKRYTNSRVMRVLSHILLGITTEITQNAKKDLATYIRILGFSKKGKDYLNYIKKTVDIPIITNIKKIQDLDDKALFYLNFEIKATNIYNLVSNFEERRSPIFIAAE